MAEFKYLRVLLFLGTTVESRHSESELYRAAPAAWVLSLVIFEGLFSPVEALISNVCSFVDKAFFLDDMLLLRQTQVATPHTRLVHTALFQKFPRDIWCGI